MTHTGFLRSAQRQVQATRSSMLRPRWFLLWVGLYALFRGIPSVVWAFHLRPDSR